MRRLTAALVITGLFGALTPLPALAQTGPRLAPAFTIWDIALGQPITQVPEKEVALIACGTNGGPPSAPLESFAEFEKCPAEPSGLHEVYFTSDDEQDYIALAMEDEYRVTHGGTTIYAHPVVFSVLVDDEAIVRGIRIVTDERASDHDRRVAATLARNLKARYGPWEPSCEDLAPTAGQLPVGKIFLHEICTADSPDGAAARMRLEATYFRKKGQTSINLETQQINSNYFQSATRLEVVEKPYEPDTTPAR